MSRLMGAALAAVVFLATGCARPLPEVQAVFQEGQKFVFPVKRLAFAEARDKTTYALLHMGYSLVPSLGVLKGRRQCAEKKSQCLGQALKTFVEDLERKAAEWPRCELLCGRKIGEDKSRCLIECCKTDNACSDNLRQKYKHDRVACKSSNSICLHEVNVSHPEEDRRMIIGVKIWKDETGDEEDLERNLGLICRREFAGAGTGLAAAAADVLSVAGPQLDYSKLFASFNVALPAFIPNKLIQEIVKILLKRRSTIHAVIRITFPEAPNFRLKGNSRSPGQPTMRAIVQSKFYRYYTWSYGSAAALCIPCISNGSQERTLAMDLGWILKSEKLSPIQWINELGAMISNAIKQSEVVFEMAQTRAKLIDQALAGAGIKDDHACRVAAFGGQLYFAAMANALIEKRKQLSQNLTAGDYRNLVNKVFSKTLVWLDTRLSGAEAQISVLRSAMKNHMAKLTTDQKTTIRLALKSQLDLLRRIIKLRKDVGDLSGKVSSGPPRQEVPAGVGTGSTGRR